MGFKCSSPTWTPSALATLATLPLLSSPPRLPPKSQLTTRILAGNGIDDDHVELPELEVFHSATLYRPVPTLFPTVRVIEPFSTAVGLFISISTEVLGLGQPSAGPGASSSLLVTARHATSRLSAPTLASLARRFCSSVSPLPKTSSPRSDRKSVV